MTNMTWLETTKHGSSAFGMPACGLAFASAASNRVAAGVGSAVTRVPSQGQVSLLDGFTGRRWAIATGAEAKGTSAWRPPTE
jgi:hypothetical protein